MANFSDYNDTTEPYDISTIRILVSDGAEVTKTTLQTFLENAYRSDAMSPINNYTPNFIGENYLDTSENIWYKAYGLTNTSWVTGGTGGSGGGGSSSIMTIIELIANKTVTGAGGSSQATGAKTTFQVFRDNSGSGTTEVNVDIEASNDDSNWISIFTLTLTALEDTAAFSHEAPWGYYRANIIDADSSSPITVKMGQI